MQGAHQGIYYDDSDVFKVVEGAAYALQITSDPELDAYLDALIAKFAAAQEEDGYLYTRAHDRSGQGARTLRSGALVESARQSRALQHRAHVRSGGRAL